MRRTSALLVLATFALSSPAEARSAAVLPYSINEVWPTAVRFIRVDRGYTVREKDEASGYILFDLVEAGRTYKGSLELIKVTDADGRDATRAAFSLPDLPSHYELLLVDKLSAKVRDERGLPPPPPRKPPEHPPAAPDAGAH